MKTDNKKNRPQLLNSKAKRVGCFMAFFLAVFFSCILFSIFLWAGGWLKDLTCSVVLEDSYLWEKADCNTEEEKVKTDVTWKENIIDMDLPEEIQSTEELVISIIEKASPAVVTVSVNNGYVDQQDGIGSGFIVDADGLILTNQHVVSDESADYSVIIPGMEEAVSVTEIYSDNTNDLAILRVDKKGLPALKLGDSDILKRGNMVIAIGNPFGDLAGTATVGYVTGLHRDVSAASGFFGGDISYYEDVIQTDAAINPGNSGGPLLNSSGEVIGINFATTSGADNISFAIPINQLKSRLSVFEKEGRFPQPYIGVSYNQRTIFVDEDIITGAVIIEVEKNGPADEAGIKANDIIVEIAGKDMTEYSLASVVSSSAVGEELKLKVVRDGKVIDLKVIVGDKGE